MTDNLIQCNLAIFMLLCPSLEWMMLEIYTSPNYAHCGRHFSYAAMSTLTYFLVYEIMTLPLSPLPLEFCDEFWQWTMSRMLCVPSDSKHFALGQDPPRLSISSMVTKKSLLYLSDQSDSPSISLNPWWNRVPPPRKEKNTCWVCTCTILGYGPWIRSGPLLHYLLLKIQILSAITPWNLNQYGTIVI